jgi:hypothetical protein
MPGESGRSGAGGGAHDGLPDPTSDGDWTKIGGLIHGIEPSPFRDEAPALPLLADVGNPDPDGRLVEAASQHSAW